MEEDDRRQEKSFRLYIRLGPVMMDGWTDVMLLQDRLVWR